MAINTSRTLNGDLHHGMVEGRYRVTAPNRGGEVESGYLANRQGLDNKMYDDINTELPSKVLPDGSGNI